MDKNFNLKKKENFVNENDENETITVKIDVLANHMLDKAIVDQIEQQLFNINLTIDGYAIAEDEKALKKALKEEALAEKARLKAEKEAEKERLKEEALTALTVYKPKKAKTKKVVLRYKGKEIG